MVPTFFIFGQVQRLTFVGVNFSVMFTDFGHIYLVILIRSCEYSSQKTTKKQHKPFSAIHCNYIIVLVNKELTTSY